MTTILVPEKIVGAPMDALRARFDVRELPLLWRDPEALALAVREADGLIVRNQTQVTAAVLAAAPQLLVVGRAGVGLDNVDVAEASRRKVVVSFAPGANANAVAELVIGYAIGLLRHLLPAVSHVRAGGWNRLAYQGHEIAGRCLAIIGCGAIGRLLAKKARALGMHVVAFDPFVADDDPELRALDVRRVDLLGALGQADVVSCHVPGGNDTTKMFDARAFATMRKGALFINTARGAVVDEAALAAALTSGHLGGAALDVRQDEPPIIGELERLPNVWLTPHVGGLTDEAQDAVLQMVCGDVAAVLEGRPAQHYANAATFDRSF